MLALLLALLSAMLLSLSLNCGSRNQNLFWSCRFMFASARPARAAGNL